MDLNAQDGKERLNFKLGCLPSLWRLAFFLIVIFNFGKILDFIKWLIERSCK